jgi:hypothetical protein
MTHTLRIGDLALEVTDEAVRHCGSLDAAFGEVLQRYIAAVGSDAGFSLVAMLRRDRQRLAGIAEQAAIQTQGDPRAIYERVLKG